MYNKIINTCNANARVLMDLTFKKVSNGDVYLVEIIKLPTMDFYWLLGSKYGLMMNTMAKQG